MSQLERYSWTEPVLCHYNHDMSQSWFVYFDFTDNLTGKTIRKQFRGNINRLHIKIERIRNGIALRLWWRNELCNGWNPFAKDHEVKKRPIHYTIDEALDAILRLHLPLLKKKTKETYTYVVKGFKEYLTKNSMQNLYIDQLERTNAIEYMDSLVTEKGYSGRTHNDHLIILATLFNLMVEKEWISKSPFRKMERKPAQVGRNIAFSEKEKEDLKKVLKQKDMQMYCFTQIMYFTFIRRTELARLRVADFDLVNKTIIIPSDVSKNGEQESVVIPVGLEPILKSMRLEDYPSGFYLFGRHLVRSEDVYSNVNHISTRHNKFIGQLKIHKSKSLYSWKHSGVVSAYYATGKDVYALMRQLRHKSLETTMIYLKSLGLIQNETFRMAMVA